MNSACSPCSTADTAGYDPRSQRFFSRDHGLQLFPPPAGKGPDTLPAWGRSDADGNSISPCGHFWKKELHLRKPLIFWARLLLGCIFVAASLDKIYQPAAFAQMIYNYQILPDYFINLAAIVLPWLELLLGTLIILGLWLPGALLLANGLLVTFFAALVFNVIRGLNVHCGCFSTSTAGKPATTLYLLRDAGFLLLGAYLLFATPLRVKRGNETSSPGDPLNNSG